MKRDKLSIISAIGLLRNEQRCFYTHGNSQVNQEMKRVNSVVIPAGCKIFDINGQKIVALNIKSALRKSKNRQH